MKDIERALVEAMANDLIQMAEVQTAKFAASVGVSGVEFMRDVWVPALTGDAVVSALLAKIPREEFVAHCARAYDHAVTTREEINKTSPYPICKDCGLAHEPRDHDASALAGDRTTH